jgi:hypothetical protein
MYNNETVLPVQSVPRCYKHDSDLSWGIYNYFHHKMNENLLWAMQLITVLNYTTQAYTEHGN